MWIALTVSFIGSFVQDVSERWLILDLTKSTLPSAMLASAFVTASLIMMLPAGVLADKRDRRILVTLSQIIQAIPAAVVSVLCLTHHVTPAVLLGASTVMGFGMALGSPAWSALVVDVIPRELVPEAIALGAVSFNVARAVGPAIGGVVLDGLGAPSAFALNAVSFLVVAGAMLANRFPKPAIDPEVHDAGITGAFKKPFQVATGDAGIRSTIVGMLCFTLGASMVYALAPAYGKTTLHASAREYGILIGAMGFGAIVGVYLLKPLRRKLAPRNFLAATALLYAVSAMVLSRMTDVHVATLVFIPAGIGWTGTFASLSALVQLWTPDRLRARVIAIYSMSHLGLWAIGATIGGVVADAISIRAAMFSGACVCLVASLLVARLPLPSSFTGPIEKSL